MTEKEMEELVAWKDSYVLNRYKDPHQVFANKLGIPRHDAKVLCYRLYSQITGSEVFRHLNKH